MVAELEAVLAGRQPHAELAGGGRIDGERRAVEPRPASPRSKVMAATNSAPSSAR